MTLRDYLQFLHKHRLIIVASLLVSGLVGLGVTLAMPKQYEATAEVIVSTSGAQSNEALAQGNLFTQARVQSYPAVATSPAVAEKVKQELGLKMSVDKLAAKISADAPLNKVLIYLHVKDHSAKQAARIANSVATQFGVVVQSMEEIETVRNTQEIVTTQNGGTTTTTQSTKVSKPIKTSPVKLTVVTPAKVPDKLVSPRIDINLTVALVLGMIIGVGLGAVRDALDNKIRTSDDLGRMSQTAILGVIPYDKKTVECPLAFDGALHSLRAEAFRQLRTNLQFISPDKPAQRVAVTSAVPTEGKTLTALNLAASLASSGKTVCLVEADLRRPTLAGLLGLVPHVGLTTMLVGRTDVQSAMQGAGLGLSVVTSGPVPPNPSELIASKTFLHILNEISRTADIVIIDAPPLLPVADAAALAAIADATLLVVRSGKATRHEVTQAVDTLAHVGVTNVGFVLNMAKQPTSTAYGYSYAEPTDKDKVKQAKREAKQSKHLTKRETGQAEVNAERSLTLD